jgi:hypothetical protein
MKTLIAAFTFAAVIAGFVPAANAAPRSDQSEAQTSGGTYQGYPLRDWYRPDSW